MSKAGKRVKDQINEEKDQESKGLIKTIFSEDTIVENPEDIIDRDPDVDRRNAFKKAYEILLAIFPETIKKKNKKKAKEKEEFDRNLAVRQMEKANLEKKEKEIKEREDKGF